MLLIGRQVATAFGKFIDLLAMDADGHLVVIELKRDRTPREVIAQALDYGSWVRTLKAEDIAAIFDGYLRKNSPQRVNTSLNEAFCDRFRVKAMPEELNEKHELVVVASKLDNSTERIISYLADEYGVAINAVFFRFFRDGSTEYLSRVWLVDPGEAETKVIEPGDEQWNGEYYCSFGHHDDTRHWDDARKHGFFAAGGGAWYTRTLQMLEPGARIWVNVPGRGYVGVGIVEDKARPLSEFTVADATGKQVPLQQIVKRLHSVDEQESQFYVKVKWLVTVPLSEAVKEAGFFGNQNSVAQPKAKKWNHTVERLKQRFGVKP